MKQQFYKKFESKLDRKAQKAVHNQWRRTRESIALNTSDEDDFSDSEFLYNDNFEDDAESK